MYTMHQQRDMNEMNLTKRFYRLCKICQAGVLNEVGLKRSTTRYRKNSVLCDALLSSTVL